MGTKKRGQQTFVFDEGVYIRSSAAVGGKKEGDGPLSKYFDFIMADDMYGEKTWEKAESKMLKKAMNLAIEKSGRKKGDMDIMLAGDLINQTMSSSFMSRDMKLPFLGLYGACSTMTESLLLGGIMVEGGFADYALCGASSHFATAERQFRMPLEHGNQRPPTAQWTATAAGAMVLESERNREPGHEKRRSVRLECGTVGKVIDAGMKDANQMGAAMAPAAVDTLLCHFQDTGRQASDYDLIITGDLGYIGKDIAFDLLKDAGVIQDSQRDIFDDCGTRIYKRDKQDVHGGGSGCGCSASVFSGEIIGKLQEGYLNRVVIMSTGALLSTLSPFQGESIPGIAHAISLTAFEGGEK